MSICSDVKLMPQIARVALYQRLFLTWAGLFVLAILYCLFRSLVDSNYLFVAGDTVKWAVRQWGAWPLLIPICVYLIQIVERRISLPAGLLAGMVFAIAGASLFAYISGKAFGAELHLLNVSYHMAPIAAATYIFFGLIAFWLYHQTVPVAPVQETAATNKDDVLLDVWSGQVQTQIEASLVEWSRAARNYVELHANGKAYLMRAGITELERLLPNGRFVRSHRSYLVNTEFVVGFSGGNSQPALVLDSGLKLPVGKKYRSAVFTAIRQEVAQA